MPTRREQRRVNTAVALFCVAFSSLMVFSYVLVAISEGLLVPKARLSADFRDAGSIGRDTGVQLAGRQIGKVVAIEFITERYPCDPQSEDFGHPYQGRTDDCEPWMFCAPVDPEPGEPGEPGDGAGQGPGEARAGVCAELEEYSGRASDYQGCEGKGSCEVGQVCVTRAFRQRYRSVRWWGQAGWCVDYDPESQRIHVTMEVDDDSLQYIKTDSRASIVLNGLLASPRVNITVGATNEDIEEGYRLQTIPSLIEEVLALKDQIDKITEDVDRGLIGVSALTDSLTDEATKADIQALRDNMSEIQRQVRDAEGLVGAVLNDPDTRAEMSRTMRETRDAASAVQADYDELERKTKRTLAKVETAAAQVEGILDGLDDPTNTSLLAILVNEDHHIQADGARLANSTREAIGAGLEAITDIDAALDEIMQAIDEREGSLGRIIADPKPLAHISDPATLRRLNVVKSLVRWVIAEDEAQGGSGADGSPD